MTQRRGIEAGRAVVRFGADLKPFEEGMRKASMKLQAFAASTAKIGATFAGLGAATLAPFVLSLRSLTSAGDDIDKSAQRAGLAADEFQRLRFALEQSGAGGTDIERLAKRIATSAKELERGSSLYVEAAEALGVSSDVLINGDTTEAVNALANAYASASNKTLAFGNLQVLAGRGAQQLIPVANAGADAIRAYGEEFDRLNLGASNETVGVAAEFTDAINTIRTSIRSLSLTVGAGLGKPLSKIAEPLAKVVGGFKSFAEENPQVFRALAITGAVLTTIGLALGGIAAAAAGLGIVATFLPAAVAALPAVAGIAAAVAGIGGVIGAVVFGLIAFEKRTGAISDAWQSLGIVFDTVFSNLIQSIENSLGLLEEGRFRAAGFSAATGFLSGFLDGIGAVGGDRVLKLLGIDAKAARSALGAVIQGQANVLGGAPDDDDEPDPSGGAAAAAASALRTINRGTFSSNPRFGAVNSQSLNKVVGDIAVGVQRAAESIERIERRVDDAAFGADVPTLAFTE